SSSVSPPHTPASWLVASANSRHSAATGQPVHTRLALSIWSSATPVVPIGKNSSGLVSRQAARLRQASVSQSWVRIHVSATLYSPSRNVRSASPHASPRSVVSLLLARHRCD